MTSQTTWLGAPAESLRGRQVSAAVTDGIIPARWGQRVTRSGVRRSLPRTLGTLIKTRHACFPLPTEAALGGTGDPSGSAFFQLRAEIISTAGNETQELPHRIRSVSH